jgi:hypothetical protein
MPPVKLTWVPNEHLTLPKISQKIFYLTKRRRKKPWQNAEA